MKFVEIVIEEVFNYDYLIHFYSDLWSSVRDLLSTDTPSRIRRRPSLDCEILEEWKLLADGLKAHENWPWALQKLFIRRHLRRQRHASEC
jgi:hypothetical protein